MCSACPSPIRLFVALCALSLTAAAMAQSEEVLTVKRDGYTIAGLAMHTEDGKSFRHGVALFPGHPGIMKIRSEDGEAKFELKGNFLIRARRFWVDDETLVLSVDAPSDQWAGFAQRFRGTPRYGEDVAALLAAAAQKYGVQQWTFVGTSEGSISAYQAARMNPKLAARLILSSSLFDATRNGPGLADVLQLDRLPERTLWVHHAQDSCAYTPYREAQDFARRSGKPLVTVRGGGPGKGDACQAFRTHGFAGVERPAVEAMRAWVKTGTAPAEVQPSSQP